MANADINLRKNTSAERTEFVESGGDVLRLSSVEIYKHEWYTLTTKLRENNLESLREHAFNGDLKVSKFRSICWSLLLRVINEEPSIWVAQKTQQREKYVRLKEEFVTNPHKENDLNDDPLSQSKQSVWNQYFGDQELFSVIKQDVVRTFPGVDFFRKDFIQEIMTNILFYYAREHPYMCYRQGMHEILAPVLFVIHCDHQALLHFQEISYDIDETLVEVLNPKFLEADAYFLFSRLMSSVESYYRIGNLIPTSEGYFPSLAGSSESPVDSPNATEVEVISQLNFIREKILAKEDLHLHNHLLKLDIPLHIFGIRWLRLLFGREFSLLDLLMIWDAIFADSDRFELPNYIVVAMLVRIRDKLLLSDYTTCLTYLMRYPNNVDVNLILRHALYMQMPTKYERPAGIFVYVTMPIDKNQSAKAVGNQASTLPRQLTAKGSQTSRRETPALTQRMRSTSLNLDRPEDIATQMKFEDIQKQNNRNSGQDANASTNVKMKNAIGVVEGYSENRQDILSVELENAQTIITITRLKLQKYLTTLRNHISRNHPDELNQAVDGIEELCAFLDVKVPIKQQATGTFSVETALEADEIAQSKRPNTLPVVKNRSLNDATPQSILRHKLTEQEAKREFVKSLSNSNVSNLVSGNNSGKVITQTDEQTAETKTRYEIPDNTYTSRMLGSRRRSVELRLFKEESLNNDDLGGVPTPDPLHLRES